MISVRNYFSKPTPPHTAGSVIKWWERRRLWYNLILFAEIILVSLVLTILRAAYESTALEWLASSLFFSAIPIISGFLLLQIPANIWYTCGWLVEIPLRKIWRNMPDGFSSWAQRIGLGFSICFTLIIMVLLSFVI
jgi:hypothetical protein